MVNFRSTAAAEGEAFVNATSAHRPDQMLAVAQVSTAYRELVDGTRDSIVEYHALRRGYDIVSRVNFTLLRRIRRRRGWTLTELT
jgi:hypothetical protein